MELECTGMGIMRYHFQYLASLCNVVLNDSKAEEPALEEWTSRAAICDKLHEPVSLRAFENSFYFLAALDFYMSTNWQVHIAMVGKYTGLSDSYLSVLKVQLAITS